MDPKQLQLSERGLFIISGLFCLWLAYLLLVKLRVSLDASAQRIEQAVTSTRKILDDIKRALGEMKVMDATLSKTAELAVEERRRLKRVAEDVKQGLCALSPAERAEDALDGLRVVKARPEAADLSAEVAGSLDIIEKRVTELDCKLKSAADAAIGRSPWGSWLSPWHVAALVLACFAAISFRYATMS